ncbi:MAG: LysR family transcriptional regulator [bacterium]|nr:LysR family transcriptional regulator [bacterium]
MDLGQMRGFLETARERSFTKAAEKLFLTQPAVSLQVKALEEELGERLFERRGKQILLTDAGRLLFGRVEEILGMVDQVRQDLSALGELKIGQLRVGTSDTNCAYVLPPVVKAFREAYPGVEIRLTDRPSSQVVRMVLEGSVDFGLATLPVSETRVETEALFFRDDVLIYHPEHLLGKKRQVRLLDLAGFPMLMLGQNSTSRMLLDRMFVEAGVVPEIAMELGSIEVIKRFVEIGLGIAMVPEVAVQEEVAGKRLVARSVDGLPARQVGLVRRIGGHLSQASAVFLTFLREHLARHFAVPA